MKIYRVKRAGYLFHRAIKDENGTFILVPEMEKVADSDVEAVREWTEQDTDRIIYGCVGVVCRL